MALEMIVTDHVHYFVILTLKFVLIFTGGSSEVLYTPWNNLVKVINTV